MKKFFKKNLLGRNILQEYLCLANDVLSDRFQIYVSTCSFNKNISDSHLFLGYKPLIIGIPICNDDEDIKAIKSLNVISLNFIFHGNVTANLELKLINARVLGKTHLFIYEGMRGSHRFLSAFHLFNNTLLNSFRSNKNGNVNLPGNLYEQVKIAYSIPRAISLISLGTNGFYNIFPTDLNGRIDNENYAISLRAGGKANRQVNEIKKITLSKIDLNLYKQVYSLGKNHMQELKTIDNFKVNDHTSDIFKNPIPEGAISFFELEHFDSLKCGIHNLNYFKIKGEVNIEPGKQALHHIHRDYAEWRKRNGLKTEYLLR